MRKIVLSGTVFGALLSVALYAAPAQAQATRTWVSGVGDDANPCSRTAPCKTFAGAISKTAANGEISVLDPGGFGAVTITKSITINGDGTLAGILAAGTFGIAINAGNTDKVVIRNISINGAGTGTHGIRYINAAQVSVINCWIEGFTGNGINVEVTSANGGRLFARDVFVTKAVTGIRLSNVGAGFFTASIDNVRIDNPTNGVDSASNNMFASVNRSVIAGASGAAVTVSAGNGTINLSNSEITNSGTAVSTVAAGSIIRVSNNNIYNNSTGFSVGSGTIATAGNNNTFNATPGATNGAITQQ